MLERVSGACVSEPAARCALQLILLQKGQPDEARAEFERLAEDEFRFVQRDWNWLPSMFVLADVCADLGDAATAP